MTATATTTIPAQAPVPNTVEPKVTSAPDGIVKRHVLMATAASCIPVPLVDMAAVMGFQLMMIKELSEHYGIKFSENRVKNIIGSLIGSFGAAPVLTPLAVSAVKWIPGFGMLASLLAMPGVAAASTYALGKVFVQHFASGGTFLDFNPEKTRAYYEQQFREAQKQAEERKESAS